MMTQSSSEEVVTGDNPSNNVNAPVRPPNIIEEEPEEQAVAEPPAARNHQQGTDSNADSTEEPRGYNFRAFFDLPTMWHNTLCSPFDCYERRVICLNFFRSGHQNQTQLVQSMIAAALQGRLLINPFPAIDSADEDDYTTVSIADRMGQPGDQRRNRQLSISDERLEIRNRIASEVQHGSQHSLHQVEDLPFDGSSENVQQAVEVEEDPSALPQSGPGHLMQSVVLHQMFTSMVGNRPTIVMAEVQPEQSLSRAAVFASAELMSQLAITDQPRRAGTAVRVTVHQQNPSSVEISGQWVPPSATQSTPNPPRADEK